MALKSSQNKLAHTKKPEENDHEQTTNSRGSSQDIPEFRRPRSKSFRKKNPRKSPGNARSLSCRTSVSSLPLVPMVSVPVVQSMAAYYRGQSLTYPARFPNWDIAAALQFQNLLYQIPLPPISIPIINPHVMPPVCPFPGGYTYPPPAIAPMPTPVLIDQLTALSTQSVYSPEQIVPDVCERHPSELETIDSTQFYDSAEATGSDLDFYLSLPKDIFPNAMMLPLDPNPIVDGFCKYNDVLDHAPWILDLEFGVPREATTRPIAMYNVKFNSIHCKNTPAAIHPGFESCDPEFKSVLTFYYDCVISMWYRGYIALNHDHSVENFQSWLRPPMQEFGMCWS